MRWIAASILCLVVTGCSRAEPEAPARDETMPATAVARSTAAMLAEIPPNERIDPDPDASMPYTNEPPKPVASPASFDCAKSTPGVEVVICADPNLAALDREMARLYGQAESEKPGDTLKRLQRGWLEKRNACAGAGSPAECLKAAYAERIHDLKVSYAAARVPGGISQGPEVWNCGDDTKLNVLHINAYNPLVVLDSSAGQVLLSRGESASGSRFAGGGYEFWQRGAEATYGRLGMPMTTCHKS